MRASLLALVVLCGCPTLAAPDDPFSLADLSRDGALFVGTWEWERDRAGDPLPGFPAETTPASTGQTRRYEFGADGTLRLFAKEALISETTWTVREECPVGRPCYAALVLGAGRSLGSMWGVDARRLVIDTRPVDGPASLYRRTG